MSGAADEKKAAPVGVANVERRTWNEQEYEEKAAQRDEEVKILFGRIGTERDGDDDGKNDDLLLELPPLSLNTALLSYLKLKTGCARRGGVQGRRPQAQEDR